MGFKLPHISLHRLKVDKLYNMYLGMNARDQLIAAIVTGVLLVGIVLIPVLVASSWLNSMEESISQSEADIRKVMTGLTEYNHAQSLYKYRLSMYSDGFDPGMSATLESIAQRIGISELIDNIRTVSEKGTDVFEVVKRKVVVKKINLEKLIEFLVAIENHDVKKLKITSLTMKPLFKDRRQMSATFEVSTYKPIAQE